MIELEVYKKSDFYEDYISSQKEYYERENADAYFAERLAKKDDEIAELKADVNNVLMQNLELCQALQVMYSVEEYTKLQDENAELKQKLQDQCISCPVKMQEDDVVAELKQKLENVQASMYADVVDANMENRRLRRALWIARANRALEKIAWFRLWNASISTMNPEDGARQEFDKWKKNLGKCLKKAEEYR